jgi:hypothetical protein
MDGSRSKAINHKEAQKTQKGTKPRKKKSTDNGASE